MNKILVWIHSAVWGMPALVLILGVGIYLTGQSGMPQLVLLKASFRHFFSAFRKNRDSFRSLCTALGATVGTGNLVGVAGAICIGGPGSIFWMLICGFFGMATKFAEDTLAVHYRETSGLAGPMYMIPKVMGNRWGWMAKLYCIFGIAAAFGVGNATQINAVVTGVNGLIQSDVSVSLGIVLALTVGALLLGGAKRIGQTAEILVPFMSAGYILLCVGVLILRLEAIPQAFRAIVSGAFRPNAVTGGMIGAAFQALQVGCARGVFTNEAGMGTASIAHGAADVAHPVEQGLMGIMEVFLDTIVICTLTALVILCSGVPIPYGVDAGGSLTAEAFRTVYGGWVGAFLTGSLCCFALATVLGWGLYGGRCAQYLFGPKGWQWFSLAQAGMAFVGAVGGTEQIWCLSETLNGLMAIPNLILLAAAAPVLRRLTIDYKRNSGIDQAGGGILCRFPSTQTAVNPHPCESSTPTRWRQRSRARRSTI